MSGAAVAAAISLSLALVAAAEEETSTDGHGDMDAGLHVEDAWARESMMASLAGAAYMTIHNDSDVEDALVGADSPSAASVEIHLSAMDDEGMMSMTPVEEIAIPAHADAVLEPGGLHIMLIDLAEPLVEGAEIEITLEFMTAEPQTVTVPVLATAPLDSDTGDSADMDMGDQGMDMGEDDTGEDS